MEKTDVIVRAFQPGAGKGKEFDRTRFEQGLKMPVQKVLRTRPDWLRSVVIVSCGDQESPAGEAVVAGMTPTMQAIHDLMPEEVEKGLVHTVLCTNWGENFGSATALNDGIAYAQRFDPSQIVIWSPEIALDGFRLMEMQLHKERHALEFCGYFRESWYDRTQWMFAQNTLCLWDTTILTNGFNPECNGTGRTVEIEGIGKVSVAGMEDFRRVLEAYATSGKMPRWGMAGERNPVLWNTGLKQPGTEEYRRNFEKIARQRAVMEIYIRDIFPDRDPGEVMAEIMRQSFFG